jgi:hypothetical protein
MMIMHGQLAAASRMASAAGYGNLSGPALYRIFVIAVVVAAAVAILQLLARSRRRPPAAGRPAGARYDWRTMPPQGEGAPMPAADEEDYGPLWRYGVPTGYGRVYDLGYGAGYDPAASPSYDPAVSLGYDLPEAPGYGPSDDLSEASGYDPGYDATQASGYDLTGALGYGPADDLTSGAGAGYGPGRWRPWNISDDAARDGWS